MIRSEPSRIKPDGIENLLLIRLRRIGDVVMTTPALTALRKTFPGARLTYLIETPYRELIEGHPDVDETLALPRRMSRSDFFRLIKRLRQHRFDAAIDFHGGPRAFQIALLSGARRRIGYRLPYKHLFYHSSLSRKSSAGAVHSVENHLNLVRLLGADPALSPRLSLPPLLEGEKKRVEDFLGETGGEKARRVVLHVGAGNRFRDWGEDKLGCLAARLVREAGADVILVGSAEDAARALRLRQTASERIHSAAGRRNLRELAGIISRSALFVGADSGPMHIAAATDTPIVALFGPTLPAHFAPWRAESRLLEKNFACRPCRQRECRLGDVPCLNSISPEEVFEACLQILDR